MQKYKTFTFSLIILLVAAIIAIFLVFRDESVLLSPYEFSQKLKELNPQKITLQDDEASFLHERTRYKVARDSLNLNEIDPKIILQTKQKHNSFLNEIGLFVVLFIGLAVIIKAISMLFAQTKPQKLEPKREFDINASNLSGTIGQKPTFEGGDFAPSLQSPMQSATTFKDVAGIELVKEELVEIIDYLKNPKKYQESTKRNRKFASVYSEKTITKSNKQK